MPEFLSNLGLLAQQHPLAAILIGVVVLTILVALLSAAAGAGSSGGGGGGYGSSSSYTSRIDRASTTANQRMRDRSATYRRDVHDSLRR